MKKIIAGLAFLLATSLSAGPLEDVVQRELRKHDSWVENSVTGKYEWGSGKISFLRCNAVSNYSGLYQPFYKVVIVPDNPHRSEVVDAIDHEMGHAIYDMVFDNYKNKYRKTILDMFLKKKIREPGVKEVIAEDIEKSKKSLASLTYETYNQFNITLQGIERDVHSVYDIRGDFAKRLLLLNEPAEVNQRFNKIWREIAANRHALKKVKASADSGKFVMSEVKEFDGFETWAIKTLFFTEKLKGLYYEIHQKGKDSTDFHRKFLNEVNSKEKEAGQSSKESPTVKKLIAKYKALTKPGYFTDLSEIFARVVDSLYSLHYAPAERNKYPLDKGDLMMLESLTYKGKHLFKKGVDKYRLGLQMIKDGYPASVVKDKLEYATSFSYKGKIYFWSEPKVSMKEIGYLKEEFQKKWGIID
ncbi:hypothetical protein KY330_05545 [Candidatus Woesearchaeota archaeon]|nr:hypothetical protein [Candidatus Woesearchaeota archaeon]